MNKQSIHTSKRRSDNAMSNITVDKDGGIQLDVSNPETTKKLLDILDTFRKARPVPAPQK
ncbi:hypothetical protein H0A64_16000 [Alcaligenaceae bacterium]|nr:hypothetical protein [Alcaligenaceae bacterium]